MTSERRKSILILSATLVIGIAIGLLVPAFFHKMHGGQRFGRGEHGHDRGHKKDWFVGTIYKVTEPDSDQVKKIRPITTWASKEIERIESKANEQMSVVLDSVKMQLKPILSDEQQKRMDDFDANARRSWKGGHHGHH